MSEYKVCSFGEWEIKPSTTCLPPQAIIYQTTDLKWKSTMGGKTEEGFTDREIAIIYEKGLAEKIVDFLNKEQGLNQ